ncbi:MAG: hypothetical protein U0457_04150 [Candidatus Sericytochromatia bacterium]
MKNIKFLSLILVLTIFSCNEIKEIKKYPKAEDIKGYSDFIIPDKKNTLDFIPTPTPTPSPIPTPNKIILSRCLDLSEYKITKKIHYPSDIVVSNDGNYIYIVTNESLYHIHKSEGNYYRETSLEDKIYYDLYPNLIYKISKNGEISNLPPTSNNNNVNCSSKVIEKDINGDLLVYENSNLYLFKDNKYQFLHKFEDREIQKDISLVCMPTINSIGSFVENCDKNKKIEPYNFYYENNYFFISYVFYFDSASQYHEENIQSYNIQDNVQNEIYQSLSSNYYSKALLYINSNKKQNRKLYPDIINFTNSIYNGKPFLSIKDIIKDKKEIEKVGEIIRIRKDSKGNLFGLDTEKNIIWKIYPNEQKIELLAGSGKAGYKDGKGEVAEFDRIIDIDVDSEDNLYVTDFYNNAIRKITPDGVVSTFYKDE